MVNKDLGTSLATQSFKAVLVDLKSCLHPHLHDPFMLDQANLLHEGLEAEVLAKIALQLELKEELL